MTKDELLMWGVYADLTLTEKIYEAAGVKKRWIDYSIPGATDPDHAWDQDKYYGDFDNWWAALPTWEKKRIYQQVTKK